MRFCRSARRFDTASVETASEYGKHSFERKYGVRCRTEVPGFLLTNGYSIFFLCTITFGAL